MSTERDPYENDTPSTANRPDNESVDPGTTRGRTENETGSESDAERCNGLFEQFHAVLTGQSPPTTPDRQNADESATGDATTVGSDDTGVDTAVAAVPVDVDTTTRDTDEESPHDGYADTAPQATDSSEHPRNNTDGRTAEAGRVTGTNGNTTIELETEQIADALATGLTAGAVDEETQATLTDHLGPSLDTAESVRLQRLDSRVSELEAYTEALEPLLNQSGTGTDITSRLETIERTLTDLEEDTLSTDGVADLSETVMTVQDQVEAFTEWKRDLAGVLHD